MAKRRFCGFCLGAGRPGGCKICGQTPEAKTIQEKNLEEIKRAAHKEKRKFYSWVHRGETVFGMTAEDMVKSPVNGTIPVEPVPIDPVALEAVEELLEKVHKEDAKKMLD